MAVSDPLNISNPTSRPLNGRDGGARAPRTERTRRRLLDSGRALFSERGPREVTSHSIAAHAGYASGTFYLHFKDKLELFRELAEEAASELERRLDSVAASQTDPVQLMQAQAEALVGFAEDQRELLRIIFHRGSEAGDIGSGILERLARGVRARRREAIADGRARDCFDSDILAQAIVGMWAHVLAWWTEDPGRASRDALVQTLTHFQLHGDRAEAAGVCGLPGFPAPKTPPSPPDSTSTSTST